MNWNIFHCFRKKIDWVVNFAFDYPEEFYERNNALMREKFFCLFQNLSEKRSDVRKTFLAEDLNCIIHIQRNFFGNFSWGSVTHAVIFELFEKDFGGFSETVFYERWGSSWKKTFFPKEMSIPKLFGAWAKFFWIVGNKLRQGSQNLIHWLQMNSLRKTMFSKKSWFFFLPHTLTQKHSENGKTFRVRSLDCINTVQKHTLGNFFFMFKDLICQFREF